MIFLALFACAKAIQGPAPQVSGVVNEQGGSTVCNAQGDPASGWLVHVLGDGFAPMPANTLQSSPGVAMPKVTLAGPETYVLPPAYVMFGDKTHLSLAIRTKDSAADAHELLPGPYSLTVANLDGTASALPNAIVVVPPPSIVSVAGPRICNDKQQQLTIQGSNFRPGMRLSFVAGATAVPIADSKLTVAADRIDATVDSGIFPSGPPGTLYTAQVADAAGCVAPYGAATRGFGVTEVKVYAQCTSLGALTMSPKFGSIEKNQAIVIHNAFTAPQKPFSGPAPSVIITAPVGADGLRVPIPLQRVAFVDANTITAVVPTTGIVPGGPYPIDVEDPTGAFATMSGAEGFTVLAEGPAIASISPAAIDTGGTADLTITSGGASFPAAAKPQIVFPAGANLRVCDLPIVSAAGAVIHAKVQAVAQASCVETDPSGRQVPAAGGFTPGAGLFVVRVQDTAGSGYADFSGLVITAPGAAPSNAQNAGAALVAARASFPLVQAGDDAGNHSLYALGGITGPMGQAATSTLASVEMAPIGPFGAIGPFQMLDRAVLSSPRHGAAAVSVQVPGDTGYVFIIGGIGSAGAAMATVERAQVLKASDAPVLSPITLAPGGSVPSGTFYYRVSAITSGGESLASDEEPVTGNGTSKAVLTWRCVTGATKYRVYRTVALNAASGSERLLAEPAPGCIGSTETFSDDGSLTPAGLRPQPPGALGNWVSMPSLVVPRGQFGARIVGDRLYVAGGCTGAACNASGGEVPAASGYETSAIAVNALGPFSGGPIGHARKQNALSVANHATAADRVGPSDAWLIVEGGIQGATVLTTITGAIEVAHAIIGGTSQASLSFGDASYNQGTDATNLNTYNFGRRGGWSEMSGDRLFGFGANAINDAILFRSGDVCNGSPCTSAASFTGNLRLEATTYTARFLPGATLYGAYVYSAGGLVSTATTATILSSVDRIPW